jgi:hypothetical protein
LVVDASAAQGEEPLLKLVPAVGVVALEADQAREVVEH